MTGGLGRTVAAGAAGLVALVVVVASAAAGALGANVGGTGANPAPVQPTLADIPAAYLALYRHAAITCPGLAWTVLAAIGTVESANGTSAAPGVRSGANSAGAEGPMQFEPATFTAYARPVPPGGVEPPSPYDPTDAIYAAARDLCANGARDGTDLPAAVYAYNHDPAYVANVLALAASYDDQASVGPSATTVVAYAESEIGTPYRWGAEAPGVAFDCSGLTQAAWHAAGVAIPRTAEAQWQQLPHVPFDALAPGDLVFFNLGEFHAGLPGHVGIYLGDDTYIDAPNADADVQVERLAVDPNFVGAARPAALDTGAGP